MEKKYALGIDLGTTNSCVGVVRDGCVEIIATDQGSRVTPSFVSFMDDDRIVGESAKAQATWNPKNTIFDVKRLIGRRYADKDVQTNLKLWPFKVINDNGNPKVEVEYANETKIFSPEEISSMVLRNLKDQAEDYLGTSVTDAVITVPAYFNDSQRQATIDAGKIAGLNVHHIINEPTAAAIAYGVDKQVNEKQNILVYDLGGGTFDVVVVSVESGIYDVIAVSGDSYLGGGDFDNVLMNYFIEEFRNVNNVDISKDFRATGKLRKACEKLKRSLSSSMKERIQVDCLYNNIDFESSITRSKFEDLCSSLVKKSMKSVEAVMKDARIQKDDIHEIVLVGGSTRIPKVQDTLTSYFKNRPLNKTINPDEAVAYGAAVYAATVAGISTESVSLQDVCPFSLGTDVQNGNISNIIKRNTKIPTERTKVYFTCNDNQEKVHVGIYEGEHKKICKNKMLGEFTLTDIHKAKKGHEVSVTFKIDTNGVLTASAVDSVNGVSNKIEIIQDKGRLSEGDISRMLEEAEQQHARDDVNRQLSRATNDLENFCLNTIEENETKLDDGLISKEGHAAIDTACSSVLSWLNDEDNLSVGEVEVKKDELNRIITGASP